MQPVAPFAIPAYAASGPLVLPSYSIKGPGEPYIDLIASSHIEGGSACADVDSDDFSSIVQRYHGKKMTLGSNYIDASRQCPTSSLSNNYTWISSDHNACAPDATSCNGFVTTTVNY